MTQARLYTSLRPSRSRSPAACSGLMYCGVPMVSPTSVTLSPSHDWQMARAIAKQAVTPSPSRRGRARARFRTARRARPSSRPRRPARGPYEESYYLARMGDDFTIRLAGVADAPTLARHRAEMFRDMGELPDELYDPLVEAAQRALDECLRTGEYVAWVVCPADHPDQIVAGAGIQLRRLLPRPEPDRRQLR